MQSSKHYGEIMNVKELLPDIVLFVFIMSVITMLVYGFDYINREYRKATDELTDIKKTNEELAAKVDELSAKLRESESRLASITASVKNVSGEIGTVADEIVDSSDRAGKISERMSGISTDNQTAIEITSTAEGIIDECIKVIEKIKKGK